MFNTIFSKGSIPIAEQVLHFTVARHEAIANNIANADTPGYKMVDAPEADFRDTLNKAIQERDGRWVPVLLFEGNHRIKPKAGGGLETTFVEPTRADHYRHMENGGGYLRHDENNFDVETQVSLMIRNTQLHNTMAQILTHQFDSIHTAIRERV